MMEFLPTSNFWLVLGILFLVLELTAIAGIGFLFAAGGAITFGCFLSFGVVESDNWSTHILYFFILTSVWAGILWYPFQKIRSKKDSEYNNIIGTSAEAAEDLFSGKIGTVKWSGTIMRATISPSGSRSKISKGETIWVQKVEEGVFYVDTTDTVESKS